MQTNNILAKRHNLDCCCNMHYFSGKCTVVIYFFCYGHWNTWTHTHTPTLTLVICLSLICKSCCWAICMWRRFCRTRPFPRMADCM